MKRLSFERLELLSLTEKKARAIRFHPKLTIISGMNGVGKSSVIKSIYWSLGASPLAVHKDWASANVKSRLFFNVDGKQFSAVRDGRQIALFDSDGNPLISTNSITHQFAPFLASMLGFGLKLPNRQGVAEILPPAYAFLPFYMDQDGGWERPLNSFDRLGQYANFRRPIIEYHSGIKPNEYYEKAAAKIAAARRISEASSQRNGVASLISKSGLQPPFTGIELSSEAHEAAIEQLLSRLTSLRNSRQKRAIKLAAILDERLLLEDQVEVVRAAARELGLDANWAASDGRESIPCPTCGTHHKNDFRNRFSILADRDECLDFVSTSFDRMEELANEARGVEVELASADETISAVQSELDEQRGRVTLREVIENEGRRQALDMFNKEMSDLQAEIEELEASIKEIEKSLRVFNKRSHREQIESFYASKMTSFINSLNVLHPDMEAVSKITGRIVETGSEQPRLLLAYNLALLATINRFSSAFIAPMVIDSPNQQDQDDANARSIISLIVGSREPQMQTILGTVSMHGIDPGDAELVEFTEKRSVLRSEEYDDIADSLRPVLEAL